MLLIQKELSVASKSNKGITEYRGAHNSVTQTTRKFTMQGSITIGRARPNEELSSIVQALIG